MAVRSVSKSSLAFFSSSQSLVSSPDLTGLRPSSSFRTSSNVSGYAKHRLEGPFLFAFSLSRMFSVLAMISDSMVFNAFRFVTKASAYASMIEWRPRIMVE